MMCSDHRIHRKLVREEGFPQETTAMPRQTQASLPRPGSLHGLSGRRDHSRHP